jgi:hypothetical protein
LLNVIPELQDKALYEIGPAGIIVRDPHTTNIPEWSEVALDDD